MNLSKQLKGCIIVILSLAICIVLLGVIIHFARSIRKKPQFVVNAEKTLQDEEKKLDTEKTNYSIEETIIALYSMERALNEATSFEELTEFILKQRPELIAKDARLLQHKFFNTYKDLTDAKDSIREMNSLYKLTANTITDILSLTGGSLIAMPTEKDKEQARKIWLQKIESAKIEQNLKNRLKQKSSELLNIIFEYSEISNKYFNEWDRLCSARDRAYLAFYERNYPEMIKSARTALYIFPDDEEASILLATALLENPGVETAEAETIAIINNMLEKSHGQSAPAFLLRGILNFKKSNFDQAILDFDQASAYFPKQSNKIDSKLDLYKKRNFLHRSREGRIIVNTYRAIMTGAGYYSPDFQKARILIAQNQTEKAKQKIFDHFFRRRLQNQWDKILNDFLFCRDFLGTDLHEILLNDKFSLKIEQSWISANPTVIITNNDTRDLHNISVLVCARFTDMMIGDYIYLPAGESVAVLPAGKSATFGKINLKENSLNQLGSEKKWRDIIEYGAVLISDEIITWAKPEKTLSAPEEQKESQNTRSIKEIINNTVEIILDKTK